MCQIRILIMVYPAFLAGCLSLGNEPTLDVTRNFVRSFDICTPQGRAQANPQGRVAISGDNAQSASNEIPPEQLIETANWAYREHLLAVQVASQCDVSETEWMHLSSALKSVAIDYYTEAGLSRREIRNVERQVSEQFVI